MFVTIVNFPPVKTGKHSEFFEWFMKTNKDFEQQYGFIRRKLLKPMNGSTYAALIEHESYETFMAMHKSDIYARAVEEGKPLFNGHPMPWFFEEINPRGCDAARYHLHVCI